MRKYKLAVWLILIFSQFGFSKYPPNHYLGLSFGIAKYRQPLMYSYSIDYFHDFSYSSKPKKSTFASGLKIGIFSLNHKFNGDTIFGPGPTLGCNCAVIYKKRRDRTVTLDIAPAYKLWMKRTKNYSIYFKAELNIVFTAARYFNGEYHIRDSTNAFQKKTYAYKRDKENEEWWVPDNLTSGISFGYLKNIRKNSAFHIKLDIIFAPPFNVDFDLAFVYPKLGVGYAFR